MIKKYKQFMPSVGKDCYIFPQAVLLGNVEIGNQCIIYPSAVIRGEGNKVTIGNGTNIQENSCIHTEIGIDVTIGNHVTVGHNAIVHACKVEDNCIIGMGVIIQNHAVIEQNCIIGAGSVVPQNMVVPEGHIAYGVPAKIIRKITPEDYKEIVDSAKEYQQYREELLKE